MDGGGAGKLGGGSSARQAAGEQEGAAGRRATNSRCLTPFLNRSALFGGAATEKRVREELLGYR